MLMIIDENNLLKKLKHTITTLSLEMLMNQVVQPKYMLSAHFERRTFLFILLIVIYIKFIFNVSNFILT